MTNLNKIWDCHLQNSCLLEEYVEEFLELYNKTSSDDETLKQLFWSRMDDILGQFFSKFVEYALWVFADPPSLWESWRTMPLTLTPRDFQHLQQPSLCLLQIGLIVPAQSVLDSKRRLPAQT
ncbi:hypothetical protein ABG768_006736 [Culter alburnus]|uniref:Uncharacterized protein n=1 Tax=Culter alburnus TaxID=194366 RepID=A0AAW1ZSG6_CULAL